MITMDTPLTVKIMRGCGALKRDGIWTLTNGGYDYMFANRTLYVMTYENTYPSEIGNPTVRQLHAALTLYGETALLNDLNTYLANEGAANG